MAEIIQAPAIGTNTEQLTKTVAQLCNLVNKLVGAVPVDSTASDVAGIVSDHNDLLAVLRGINGR